MKNLLVKRAVVLLKYKKTIFTLSHLRHFLVLFWKLRKRKSTKKQAKKCFVNSTNNFFLRSDVDSDEKIDHENGGYGIDCLQPVCQWQWEEARKRWLHGICLFFETFAALSFCIVIEAKNICGMKNRIFH